MWLLSFIPENLLLFFIHGITAFGIILYLLSRFSNKIPFISKYSIPMGFFGFILFFTGVFFEGAYQEQQTWQKKVQELQNELKIAQQVSAQDNTKIQTQVVTQIQTVHDVKTVIQTQIKEIAPKIDLACKVDPSTIDILNKSASNKVPLK